MRVSMKGKERNLKAKVKRKMNYKDRVKII